MIEVEKKFVYDQKKINTLIEEATFLNEKIFTDSYFDNDTFSLTSKDIWFRERSGRFELKLPLNENVENRISDQYRELETEKEIAEYFGWDLSVKSFKNYILENRFKPFATYTTTRKKYKRAEFTIDIDTTDFGFNIIEIELMVQKESEIKEGVEKILTFAASLGLELGYVRGKVIEFIQAKIPKHFQALVDARVVK